MKVYALCVVEDGYFPTSTPVKLFKNKKDVEKLVEENNNQDKDDCYMSWELREFTVH